MGTAKEDIHSCGTRRSMGTCLGLAKYARENKLGTTIVPVLCVEGEEVPGGAQFDGGREGRSPSPGGKRFGMKISIRHASRGVPS